MKFKNGIQQEYSSGTIKPSLCIYLCVCTIRVSSNPGAIKVLSCVSWGLVVGRRIAHSKATCVSTPRGHRVYGSTLFAALYYNPSMKKAKEMRGCRLC